MILEVTMITTAHLFFFFLGWKFNYMPLCRTQSKTWRTFFTLPRINHTQDLIKAWTNLALVLSFLDFGAPQILYVIFVKLIFEINFDLVWYSYFVVLQTDKIKNKNIYLSNYLFIYIHICILSHRIFFLIFCDRIEMEPRMNGSLWASLWLDRTLVLQFATIIYSHPACHACNPTAFKKL